MWLGNGKKDLRNVFLRKIVVVAKQSTNIKGENCPAHQVAMDVFFGTGPPGLFLGSNTCTVCCILLYVTPHIPLLKPLLVFLHMDFYL